MQPRIYQLCKSGNCAEMKKPNVCNLWIGIGLELEFGFQMNLVLELLDVVLLCILF